MAVIGKGKSGFEVEWVLRDKDGNVKDKGTSKEEETIGNVSK